VKICVTSIAAEDIAQVLRGATSGLEDALVPAFAEKSYGADVQQFSAIVVAVDSGPITSHLHQAACTARRARNSTPERLRLRVACR
jgi:hypothetical protein